MEAHERADLVRALRDSLLAHTGRDLAHGLDLGDGLEAAVRRAPYVLVAHDVGDDPVFVYGNNTALALFELDWDAFTRLPSRLAAENVEQDERDSLLARVRTYGYIDDYRGVRVSSTGRRFLIEDAVVWNVVDDNGHVHGQAALFDSWIPLDAHEHEHHDVDWSRRHDLGWSGVPADAPEAPGVLVSDSALAAVAPPGAYQDQPRSYDDHHDVLAGAATASWTVAYAELEPAAGEHLHATMLATDQISVVDDVSVVEHVSVVGEVSAVQNASSGRNAADQESVRTYLTLGPRTGSDLSIGYDVSAPPEIRPLSRDELDVVVSWAHEEGWNPGLADAEALWAADQGGLWGVEIDGVLVGSGATIRRGPRAAVVGMLLVQRDHRGMGIGSVTFPFLVDGALSRLERGATLELHTPEARQDFCERFGFRAVGRTARMTGVGAVRRRGPYAGQLRALATLPFDKVVAYDAGRVGAERPDLLRAWITPTNGHGIAAYEEGRLIGMGVMRPCATGYRVGPLFADSPDIADELLVALSGTVVGQPVTLDVPTENPDALGLAAHHALTETSSLVRMRLGDAVDPAPASVFAVTAVEFG